MTNLYDFLRKIHATASADEFNVVQPTDDELKWLENFLRTPDTEIHFKAIDTGDRQGGLPVMWQDYAIAGKEEDVFCLISEAALLNIVFQNMIRGAIGFIDTNIRNCKLCHRKHNPDVPCPPAEGWKFTQ